MRFLSMLLAVLLLTLHGDARDHNPPTFTTPDFAIQTVNLIPTTVAVPTPFSHIIAPADMSALESFLNLLPSPTPNIPMFPTEVGEPEWYSKIPSDLKSWLESRYPAFTSAESPPPADPTTACATLVQTNTDATATVEMSMLDGDGDKAATALTTTRITSTTTLTSTTTRATPVVTMPPYVNSTFVSTIAMSSPNGTVHLPPVTSTKMLTVPGSKTAGTGTGIRGTHTHTGVVNATGAAVAGMGGEGRGLAVLAGGLVGVAGGFVIFG